MQQETIEVGLPGQTGGVKLTVCRANFGMGADRARLRAEAFAEQDVARRAAALRYADLLPVTLAAEGIPWPLTLEQCIELDDEVGQAWEQAVYRLNPHWYGAPDADEQKNAVTPSTGGS